MAGFGFLFRIRSWLFVEEANPPHVVSGQIRGHQMRIYWPYRDRPADHLTMSHVFDPTLIRCPAGTATGPFHQRVNPGTFPFPVLSPGGTSASLQHYLFNCDGRFRAQPPAEILPADTIRIDVEGTDNDPSMRHAWTVFNDLMKLLRWRSGQWWLTRTPDGLVSPGGISFPIDDDGVPVNNGIVQPHVSCHTLSGLERRVDHGIWMQAIQDVQAGTIVPIHDVLLLDAAHSLSIQDLRQTVMQAASACDIVKENTCERLWLAANPGGTYDRDRLLRGWNMIRHFRDVIAGTFRRNYETEHPAEWALLDQLWDARGNVAHGAANTFGDPPVQVTDQHAGDFVRTARHCVNWLLSL